MQRIYYYYPWSHLCICTYLRCYISLSTTIISSYVVFCTTSFSRIYNISAQCWHTRMPCRVPCMRACTNYGWMNVISPPHRSTTLPPSSLFLLPISTDKGTKSTESLAGKLGSLVFHDGTIPVPDESLRIILFRSLTT